MWSNDRQLKTSASRVTKQMASNLKWSVTNPMTLVLATEDLTLALTLTLLQRGSINDIR